MYAAPTPELMPPMFVNSFGMESTGRVNRSTAPTSGTWVAINRIIYVPFSLNRTVTAYRLFWLNGATVGTNNLQAGVYDQNFARMIAGTSTLSAGANICQFDNITDTVIGPGRFYMALWGSGVTMTVLRTSTASSAGGGVYYETAAGGLPATATPVSPATTALFIPVFGLALRATP